MKLAIGDWILEKLQELLALFIQLYWRQLLTL